MILPQHVGHTFHIHTGKAFLPLLVREEMVGHKFGEFASTRRRAVHKKKTKKK
jgi:small subunit ribosomal protein S19